MEAKEQPLIHSVAGAKPRTETVQESMRQCLIRQGFSATFPYTLLSEDEAFDQRVALETELIAKGDAENLARLRTVLPAEE